MDGAGLRRVGVSTRLVAIDLFRNRVAVGLFLVIPIVFYVLVAATTGDRDIVFELAGAGRRLLTENERHLSLLFIGMVSISGVSAFLAFVLVLRTLGADRRLAFEGYQPIELLAAKVCVVLAVAVIVAVYVTALLQIFFRPPRVSGVFWGFLLTSFVYGTFGMIVGAVVRRELEGILLILLLVNIDAGWLQSPVFYAHARNQALIRVLPGHHPGQITMLSAFTTTSIRPEVVAALAYAAGGLLVAAGLYWLRVRVHR
jgi:ABC-2 type transport system permease protein